ncbi:hypothetical protein SELMODRAFT_73601 [Selaginella moellendorffii]|uniref:Pentacotripeptide-repeat region of PRORP domain-containing protein n=1 Tax=Selaginella moellendorffii TaxID=88036 RepID=D8QR65_SELML|nr:hypothetical protein SELMODRAFT_73601 [Selaginella moellendorffii]
MLTVYAHNGRPWDAKNLFDRIPGGRDSVAWSCLIGAFVKIGDLEHARRVFDLLPRWTVVTSTAILVALAKRGKAENARAMFLAMPERDLVAWNAMITAYAQNGNLQVAQAMFFRMPARNFVSWNAIIDGCAQGQDEALAKKVFDSMPQREVVSWTAMVATYSQSGRLEEAQALLSKMPALNIVSWNVMIQAFADNLLVEEAKERFDRAPEHDFVSWNAIITAYAQTSQIFLARAAFDRMPQRDVVSWATMIQSYAQEGQPSMDQAKEIFDRAPQRNVVSWNVMITGYSASGRIKQSRGLFERMPMMAEHDLVSWNALIAGHLDNGLDERALQLFLEMDRRGCSPDPASYTSALAACAGLASLGAARDIHWRLCKAGLETDAFVHNALVDFYGKSGRMADAELVFQSLASVDVVTWNALAAGLSRQGSYRLVVDLLWAIKDQGLEPDGITFLALLAAYGHAGLVDHGRRAFAAMVETYRIEPGIEHYHCLVDMLGRANRLEEAVAVVSAMPHRPSSVTWTTVLSACVKWKNLGVASVAFESLLGIDPDGPAAYVLMANVYGSAGMAEEEAKLLEHVRR